MTPEEPILWNQWSAIMCRESRDEEGSPEASGDLLWLRLDRI
jgi:hypothetical protein